MRHLYTLLFYLATPFIMARLLWKSRREPNYRRRWRERFGIYPDRRDRHSPRPIWLHAVSVGEAEAAFPLIRALAKRFPATPILVTTTTPTGAARVQAVLGDRVTHVYLPYDLPAAVARFLNHFQPRIAVILETEIWPNLYRACGLRDLPLAVVNARLSPRSARGYAKLAALSRDTLRHVRLIAAQTQADAERFLQIGADPTRVRVLGNLKYDLELPADYGEQAARLKQRLFPDRPVFIAASTHDGEEAQILQAFAALRRQHPTLLLALVPRHPPRFDSVAALCQAQGHRLARRSRNETAAQADIFLVDTLGELRQFYATADLAFVGGSLVAVGGHNVLEPALAGVPVLFGPHMFNFAEAARLLLQADAALQATDPAELAAFADNLLQTPARAQQMGENGRQFVEAGRGALQRIEHALAAWLA